MRTRQKTYSDYGISDAEVKYIKEFCQNSNDEEKQKDYEKVKTYFETELSMLPEESLDSVECEEIMGICLKAIAERN